MLAMSRSKTGIWAVFMRTAMREGCGSWSSGVFCMSDQRRTVRWDAIEKEEARRQELHQPLSRLVLSCLRRCDAVLEIINDDVRARHQRLPEHAI